MTSTAFKPMGLPKKSATEAELDSYVKERGVPVLVHETPPSQPSAVPAHTPVIASTAESRRLSVQVPDYLWRKLKVTAGERGCTVRYLIFEALRTQGYDIQDADFFEDGRRDT